jgi:hypothetical protein
MNILIYIIYNSVLLLKKRGRSSCIVYVVNFTMYGNEECGIVTCASYVI